MNIEKLTKLYKYGAIAAALVGVLFAIVPISGTRFTERIWVAMVLNIGYHMMFQLISRRPNAMYEKVYKDKLIIGEIGLFMLKCFSIGVVVMSCIAASAVIFIAVSENSYTQLIALLVIFGVVIGGLTSWLRLKAQ